MDVALTGPPLPGHSSCFILHSAFYICLRVALGGVHPPPECVACATCAAFTARSKTPIGSTPTAGRLSPDRLPGGLAGLSSARARPLPARWPRRSNRWFRCHPELVAANEDIFADRGRSETGAVEARNGNATRDGSGAGADDTEVTADVTARALRSGGANDGVFTGAVGAGELEGNGVRSAGDDEVLRCQIIKDRRGRGNGAN
jgi:hypothetical protein